MAQLTRIFSFGSNSMAQLRARVNAQHLESEPAIVADWVTWCIRMGGFGQNHPWASFIPPLMSGLYPYECVGGLARMVQSSLYLYQHVFGKAKDTLDCSCIYQQSSICYRTLYFLTSLPSVFYEKSPLWLLSQETTLHSNDTLANADTCDKPALASQPYTSLSLSHAGALFHFPSLLLSLILSRPLSFSTHTHKRTVSTQYTLIQPH